VATPAPARSDTATIEVWKAGTKTETKIVKRDSTKTP
jgi:hypothetical protein